MQVSNFDPGRSDYCIPFSWTCVLSNELTLLSRIADDDPTGRDPVPAGLRVSAAGGLLRQQPAHVHRLLQEDPRGQLAGGAVRRGGQAEPEHLLGRVHPQQVPRGGRAPLLHHQDGRSATGSDTLGKDTVA